MSKTLLYDNAYDSGHHVEYIQYIITYVIETKNELQFAFFIHPSMRKYFAKYERMVDILYLSDDDLQYIEKGGIVEKGNKEWEILKTLMIKENCTSLLFLHFDSYQYLVGTRKVFQSGFKISGILFSPPYRLPLSIRRTRKFFQLKWCLQNSNIESLFILNDKDAVAWLNTKYKSVVFNFLPDPIDTNKQVISDRDAHSKKYSFLENDGINMAILGSIGDRKNVLNILNALDILMPQIDTKINLVIAGNSTNKIYTTKVESTIKSLLDKYESTKLDIRFINSYITDDEFHWLLQQTNIILCPYKDFYFSSGLVNYGIMYKKIVICSFKSLSESLVNEHGMGRSVNPKKPENMADGMLQLLENYKEIGYNLSIQREFVNRCNPNNFSKKIIDGI